ncbi:hypothetical protein JQC92_22160 [Shewanella sp. 202IG2-18]|uniref:hypothetical protein n=1 Tax=Parashewanella hymeniacidonis TaxID=2807618 RepID=UPI001961086B|nr:hypothetical protein [Parashewanella hymeniacidonis]MBM7074680.1 hypothetical protein [Parashewanella hymeniacidonis]
MEQQSTNTINNRIHYSGFDYFCSMLSIWILLPIGVELIIWLLDIKRGEVVNGETATFMLGDYLDFIAMFAVLLLYIHRTYKRVSAIGFHKLFTIVFCVPVVNFMLFFIPSKKI